MAMLVWPVGGHPLRQGAPRFSQLAPVEVRHAESEVRLQKQLEAGAIDGDLVHLLGQAQHRPEPATSPVESQQSEPDRTELRSRRGSFAELASALAGARPRP